MKKAPGQIRASDLRSRNDLVFFVLALIEGGIDTPYSLRTKVGLSQGATIPILRRLDRDGAIRPLSIGTRGKKEYRITAVGKEQWRKGFRDLWSAPPPPDGDAVLRVAALAVIAGVERRDIRAFLRLAAGGALAKATHLRTSTRESSDKSLFTTGVTAHNWMRFIYSQKKLQAEARTYRAVANKLARLR